MEPVSFYISSAKELKTKVDAFRILFDRAPKITIYGKMIEKSSGDIAFLDSGSNVSFKRIFYNKIWISSRCR